MTVLDEIEQHSTLPHNLEAERAVLGAILVHNAAFDHVSQILKPADFYRDAHQRIYRAIVDLIGRSVVVDFVTVREELTRTKQIEEVGGPAYVAALADGVPKATNIQYYGRIVKEKATLRAIIHQANKVLQAAYAAEVDADEILSNADRAWLDLQHGTQISDMVPVRDDLKALFDHIEQASEHRDQLLGLTSGFPKIDELTLGWQRGDMIVVAARPSMGKTTLVVNMAVAAAQQQQAVVGMFSIEMKRQQIHHRMLSSISQVAATRILTGHLGSADYGKISAALETLNTLPFYINDQRRPTFWDIRAAARRLKAAKGLDLLIIDYVQLMPGSLDRKGATRNDEISDISRRIKVLAGELDIPVILLSQLSRAGAKRQDQRPRLEDLRDSGALEQDADTVVLLHRQDHREGGATEAIFAKQRNGATGTVLLEFDPDVLTFREKADQTPEEPAPARERRRRRATRGPWLEHLGSVDDD